MKALVIRQPWAWGVVYAGKPELRDARINHRDPIAIVAAKDDDEDGYRIMPRVLRVVSPSLTLPPRADLVRRAIVGVGPIAECVDLLDALGAYSVRRIPPAVEPWLNKPRRRRYAVTFAHMVPIVGVTLYARGMPGLFNLPESVVDALLPIYLKGKP